MRLYAPSDMFQAGGSLADVDLSIGAWHFIDNVCLLLPGERVLDLCEERTEGGSGLEYVVMLKSLHTLLIHSLTPAM